MSRSIGIACPFCGSRMWVHKVEQNSKLLKQMTATCKNTQCLASVTAFLEINHIIHPSRIRAPEIVPAQTTMEF